jgi:hypothetical protein
MDNMDKIERLMQESIDMNKEIESYKYLLKEAIGRKEIIQVQISEELSKVLQNGD